MTSFEIGQWIDELYNGAYTRSSDHVKQTIVSIRECCCVMNYSKNKLMEIIDYYMCITLFISDNLTGPFHSAIVAILICVSNEADMEVYMTIRENLPAWKLYVALTTYTKKHPHNHPVYHVLYRALHNPRSYLYQEYLALSMSRS